MKKGPIYPTLPTRPEAKVSPKQLRLISKTINATSLLPAEKSYLLPVILATVGVQAIGQIATVSGWANIWSRFTFERWLRETVKRYEPRNDEERGVLEAVKSALESLKTQPAIFTGDPYGDFTYDHPVLAIALSEFQTCFRSFGPTLLRFGDEFSAWRWVSPTIHAVLSHGEKSLAALRKLVPGKAIHIDRDVTRIAVSGDAGYNNSAQQFVIQQINRRHSAKPFDLFIHLGDTYLSGKDDEFLNNLLAPFAAVKMKKVAICGNHDIYRGGEGFEKVIQIWEQPGRYFAIQTPDWVIACLDSSLAAPDVAKMDGTLDDEQFAWLRQLIRDKGDKKLVVMTHHFPVSAWSKSKPTIAAQLKPCVQDIFAWYWGHEHSCATYSPAAGGYYGACIGNGAFKEPWSTPTVKTQSLDWYAKSSCVHFSKKELTLKIPFLKNRHFWPHGFLELELSKSGISETYHVEDEPAHTRILPSLP